MSFAYVKNNESGCRKAFGSPESHQVFCKSPLNLDQYSSVTCSVDLQCLLKTQFVWSLSSWNRVWEYPQFAVLSLNINSEHLGLPWAAQTCAPVTASGSKHCKEREENTPWHAQSKLWVRGTEEQWVYTGIAYLCLWGWGGRHVSLRWEAGLSRDGAVSGNHSYCFRVHITFHPAQHCSIVRQKGYFTRAQAQHQTTERKIKKRVFTDDI